jgi:hypothetical protein
MKSLRTLVMGIAAAIPLVTASVAGAHTVKICWRAEANGSTTFYARNFHGPQQPTGALLIDGVSYPFTAAALGRPPADTVCQPVPCDSLAIPNAYLAVNVPHVSLTPHSIGVTCANDISCGWPGCYPTPVDFSPECADTDEDLVCDDEDNCPDLFNDDQADADGDSIGDACDSCPRDPFNDEDADGVCGDVDACPGTTLPESVPTLRLGVNRFANTDADGTFDTTPPAKKAPKRHYTVVETGGCSCAQIIDATGAGNGHRMFGCSIEVMETWVGGITP